MKAHSLQLIVLSAKGKRFFAPQTVKNGYAFVQLLGAHQRISFFTKGSQRFLGVSQTDGTDYPSPGKLIQVGESLRHEIGTMTGEWSHHQADLDACCLQGNRGQCNP